MGVGKDESRRWAERLEVLSCRDRWVLSHKHAPVPSEISSHAGVELRNVGPHFGYMIEQSKAGLVLAAGPSAAGREGFYIVKATRPELDKLLADDPGRQSGLLKPEVLPWHVLDMKPPP